LDDAARVARVQEDAPMKIAKTTVLVTEANRGIGQSLAQLHLAITQTGVLHQSP
jgi:hypothetical protein